jgi:hypothetical protein
MNEAMYKSPVSVVSLSLLKLMASSSVCQQTGIKSPRVASRVFDALCEIIVATPPPPFVYIVYWYICLTLNRVKVHKYLFFDSKITVEFAGALHVTREIVNY